MVSNYIKTIYALNTRQTKKVENTRVLVSNKYVKFVRDFSLRVFLIVFPNEYSVNRSAWYRREATRDTWLTSTCDRLCCQVFAEYLCSRDRACTFLLCVPSARRTA